MGRVECFLVKEACVGVVVGGAGFLLSVPGNSQWLGLCAFTVKGAKHTDLIPGWGERSLKLPKRKKKKTLFLKTKCYSMLWGKSLPLTEDFQT